MAVAGIGTDDQCRSPGLAIASWGPDRTSIVIPDGFTYVRKRGRLRLRRLDIESTARAQPARLEGSGLSRPAAWQARERQRSEFAQP